MNIFRLLGSAALALPLAAQTPEQLNFLTGLPDGGQLREMLPSYLKGKAFRLLNERSDAVKRLASAGDVEARRLYIRQKMWEAIGGPLEKTPLNPRVTGVLERDAYRIEKIVFESQPRFYVTANLYVPKRGRPPFPGILFPLGHEAGAKAHHAWQSVLGSLATKGFVCLAWEPIGQGERVQLWDEDFLESKVVRSTTEHTLLGVQAILVGDSLARYTIWDGIRALDYLLSRPEVDAKRIGVTGNSGGGTHTAYLTALEDRIHVAAPSCYITSWRRLLETIGPQDAEQCLPSWLAHGLDHGDFLLAFAPRPNLMLTAIRDFFSITGARETYREARDVYQRIGAPGSMAMIEADDGHGYTLPRRLAAYRWFSRWLQGDDSEQTEPEILQATEEELRATETGQVATSLGGETVTTLNQKRLEQVGRRRPAPLEQILKLTGHRYEPAAVKAMPFGSIDSSRYRVDKLVYESEPGIDVPAVLYVPRSPAGRKPAVVLLHGQGKAAARVELEQLAGAGLVVLAIDARGWGQTQAASERGGSDWPRYFGDFHSAMTALLVGDSLVGMRALDVRRGVDLLAAHGEVDSGHINGFGFGAGAVPLLHAAAFDSRIGKVALEGMLASYESVVRRPIHRGVFENVVSGALRYYDLPDLAALIAPRPVWLVDATDPLGKPAPLEQVRAAYAAGRPAVRVIRRKPGDTIPALYGDLWR